MAKKLKAGQKIKSNDGFYMCRIENPNDRWDKFDPNDKFNTLKKWCRKNIKGTGSVSGPIAENAFTPYGDCTVKTFYYFGFKDKQDLLMFQLTTNDTKLYPMWPSGLSFTITEQD